EFSRLLAFRDRIQRDDWLKQAKFFYDKNRKRSVAA
ncbi:MAG: putative flap endonuclease-1-like 5' DNA nuclease, partial [Mariniblastus sp.]